MKIAHPLFIKSVHVTHPASLFSALVLVVVLHGYIDPFVLYGWLAASVLIIALRIRVAQIYPSSNKTIKHKKRRKILVYLGITLSGIIWASTPWLLFPDDPHRQMFIVFVIMGLTAGAPSASGTSILAFLCFTQPILLSLTIRYLYEGTEAFVAMAIMTQLYNIALIITSSNFSKIDHRLRVAIEAAETASLAKSEFLANISHEIRTPMNAIVGINYLLKQTTLTTQQLDYVDKSFIASNALLGSIENILDYSKVETQKSELKHSSFHLKAILNTVITLVELDVKKKGLKFSSTIIENTTTHLKGDSIKLVQILSNLTKNAVKFTDKGEIDIIIEQIGKTQTKVLLHFSVRDTGIGIDIKDHKKVFKSFSQVNTSHSRQYGGTGLGLSISQQLANLMGSEIELESELNQGSTFNFSIWFDTCLNEEVSKTTLPDTSVIAQSPWILPVFEGSTVLLVEDDELNQLVASNLLTLLGIKVEIADSAEQAFSYLDKYLPDLIILDIQMPHMDGYEAIKVIRSTRGWKDLPVICMTAHASEEEKEKALLSGMDDFLTKPIDPFVLRSTLKEWLPLKSNTRVSTAIIENNALGQPTDQSRTEIKQNIASVMDMLEDKKSSKHFFESAKASLIDSMSTLNTHLTNNDWKDASQCAHKLRGTANFYASSNLQDCLQNIDEGLIDKHSLKETQQLLRTEFELVLNLIDKRLLEQRG
ncbi:MAG: response regulator [Thiotrichaceae bacterium]